MIESVVLPLLVEVAKPMVQALRDRVLEEMNLNRGGFKNELSKLERRIQPIENIVLNMDESDKAVVVEGWVRNVVSILYNAEDMLDVLAYEKQRQVVMKRRPLFRSRRLLFWPVKRVYFRSKMGKWIGEINNKIDVAIKEAKNILELKGAAQLTCPLSAVANDRLQQIRTNVDMSRLVGRDSDVHFVVDKLCEDSHNTTNRLSVVAIVGFGGIGKTVVAKQVIENKRVTDKFKEIVWVVVSADFSIEKILGKMLELVDMNSGRAASSSEIAERKLKGILDGKRYLLVLDDVWNTHQGIWDAMKSSLESICTCKGSMILVTTRNKAVAEIMQASAIHDLQALSEDDSWSLFKQVAFANKSLEYISMVETTGKKIAQKCKGVALAIKTIGGMLQTKRHPYEWDNIEQSELWDLPQDDAGILPSLKLSYTHLPSPYLKKCFSFCAILSKDCSMEREWLINCWRALGLIQQFSNRDVATDIAQEYIHTLVNISFLQEDERDELGEITYYSMHDLVHDLARSVSRHEILVVEGGNQGATISDVVHLSIDGQDVEVTSDKVVLENLRTLYIEQSLPRGLLKQLKYLRVLDLEDLGLEEVPKSIAGLKCLKYLNLKDNPIRVLPEFITELYNLQCLILDDCDLLTEVPRGLSNLVNLMHLGINTLHNFPAGMIGQLSCLEIVPALCVSEGGFQISELRCLPLISDDLTVSGLEQIKTKQEAEAANLLDKSRIKRLELVWDSDDNWTTHEKVLDGLKPHCNLRLLTIEKYGGEKFPSWVMKMDAVYNLLKMINLVDCTRCQKLPTLGCLPFLEILKIKDMGKLEKIGQELYHDSSIGKSIVYFPRLKQLKLCRLPNLTEWGEPIASSSGDEFSVTTFPCLERLVMKDCPKLSATPNEFPSLDELIVIKISSVDPLLNMISKGSSLTSLDYLHIEEVEEMTHLPTELTACTSLQTLIIHKCKNLKCLPKGLSKLSSLQELQVHSCPKLVSVPNISWLRMLDIFDNVGLKSVPEGLPNYKLLESLGISHCPKIKTLPDLTGLTRLSDLDVRGMTTLIVNPPEWLCNLPCLRVLHIGNYWWQKEFPDLSFLSKITTLEVLYLYGWDELHRLPVQVQHLKTLKELGVYDFKNLESLPDWIGNISSLENLNIGRCDKLKEIPMDAIKRLTKFSDISISDDCPLRNSIGQSFAAHYGRKAKCTIT